MPFVVTNRILKQEKLGRQTSFQRNGVIVVNASELDDTSIKNLIRLRQRQVMMPSEALT